MNRKFISNSNYVLNKVLKKEGNIDILKDLIEAILKIEIQEISYQKEDEIRSVFGNIEEIANVEVITKNDERLNIGIRIQDGYYLENKIILYYAQTHSSQLNNDDSKTITINIIDDDVFEEEKYYKVTKVKRLNTNISEKINPGEIHSIELPKFKIKEITAKDEAWIQYFKTGIIEPEYEKIKKLDDILNQYWREEIL